MMTNLSDDHAAITKGNEVKASSSGSAYASPKNNLCILIVDDQPFTRFVHQAMVTSLGLDSQLAENGKIAVDLHRAGASFDLILMDRDMPVMNGAQATKELRAMGVETRIVGVTAHEEGPVLAEFIESGLSVCYAKPISISQIKAFVKLVKQDKNEAEKNIY